MKLNLKKVLDNHINDVKGSYDRHFVIGSYGVSYNVGLDYVAIYKIVKDDKENTGYYIEERFFQGSYEYSEILGKKFIDNSEATQIAKARKYFNDYCY